jgi:catechol-2,3-dioxygenase
VKKAERLFKSGSKRMRRRANEAHMIDHVGIAVSDYERAKAFYPSALAPRGHLRRPGLASGRD